MISRTAPDHSLPAPPGVSPTHPLTASAVRKVYRLKAPIYNLVFGPCFEPGRRRAVAALDSQPGERILEVGVGTGLALRHWDPRAHVVGIDLSPQMLAHAERIRRRHDWRHIRLEVMDAQATTFPDSSFDKVAAMYVVSAAPDPDALLREIRRVCKPGGRIVIVNHFEQPKAGLPALERFLARYAGLIGFNASLPLTRVTRAPGLAIRRVQPANWAGYWTLVEAENLK